MKRTLLIAALCSCVALPSLAESFTEGKLVYNVTDAENLTVEIAEVAESAAALSQADIASTVVHGGKTYTITAIGDEAFYGAVFEGDITFPVTLASIGECAFEEAFCVMPGQDDVEDEDKVRASFTFSSPLSSIADGAFAWSVMKNLTLPGTLATLGDNVFNYSEVEAFLVTGTGSAYASQDGLLLSADKKTLIAYPSASATVEFTVPSFVENIGEGAFYGGQVYLEKVVFPTTVKSIGINAFRDSAGISSVIIQNPDIELGEAAFFGLEGVTELQLPVGLKSIPKRCFFDLSSLKTLVIPEGVTSIGDEALSWGGFTEITFPSTLVSTGRTSMSQCVDLTSVQLPASMQTLGEFTFAECSSLVSVSLGGTKTVGENAFSSCTALKEVTGANVETLADGVFFGCTALEKFPQFPALKSIGAVVVLGCKSLTEFVIPASVTTIGRGIAANATALPAIAVADGNECFAAIDGVLYDKGVTKLLAYPCGRPETSFTLPASVVSVEDMACRASNIKEFNAVNNDNLTAIRNMAFLGCNDLTTVSLGKNVAEINSAFKNCAAITNVISLNPVPPTGGVFADAVYQDAALYVVSDAAKAAYAEDADWGKFQNASIAEVGISAVACDEPAAAEYFDTMGRKSSEPFRGSVNIVVYTFPDGTKKVEKKMM